MTNQTSAEWWKETKNDEAKLNNWLERQFHGEYDAAERIKALSEKFPTHAKSLMVIADQEYKHAGYIATLCGIRNIPTNQKHEGRYWKNINLEFDSVEEAAAVGAHAEEMRLERIRCIANDPTAPTDIQMIFIKILKDEEFHAEFFRNITTDELYEAARTNHETGVNALGLLI